MTRRVYVAVAASSEEPDENMLKNSMCFINELSKFKENIVIVLGGYWGLMKNIADYAIKAGIQTMFILPDNPPIMPPNNEYTIIVQSDLGFPTRSTIMCKTGDILVAMGGSIGSIIEIMLSYDFWKPIVVVKSGKETDKVPQCFGKYIDHRMKAELSYARDGCEAGRIVADFIRELLKR
ncbi:conserved hypothetical protein [Staphylothermus marinus F1]|uniref:LOG family protein n=1 Tax=Staphylothermus marinus (strain ATCC 43588 / DSM 3639 / JCM 9404 / F1) TaxID=399550 RepID=A3DPN1_STAMF|nr:hypothetical protein [Staphylothermus marinus]ABN70591.1 conserved hypothetical protein [Staphylothermus marinus F1]